MTEFLRMAVTFFAAINPAAVALGFALRDGAPPREQRLVPVGVGAAIAALLVGLAAVCAQPVLDFLQIEPETFRVAAGVVMAGMGVLALWSWRAGPATLPDGWQSGLYPLGMPLLAGPAGLMAAVSYGADKGAGLAFAAALPALAVSAVLATVAGRRLRFVMMILAPLTGAVLIAMAAGLIVSGVRDV